MRKDNFKAAAAKLQQASRLGNIARQMRRTQPPPSPRQQSDVGSVPVSAETQNPVQGDGQHHIPYQPYRQPQPVRTGFGLGLGFAAGTALFRLGVFLIGVVLMFAFFASIFDAIGF